MKLVVLRKSLHKLVCAARPAIEGAPYEIVSLRSLVRLSLVEPTSDEAIILNFCFLLEVHDRARTSWIGSARNWCARACFVLANAVIAMRLKTWPCSHLSNVGFKLITGPCLESSETSD